MVARSSALVSRSPRCCTCTSRDEGMLAELILSKQGQDGTLLRQGGSCCACGSQRARRGKKCTRAMRAASEQPQPPHHSLNHLDCQPPAVVIYCLVHLR